MRVLITGGGGLLGRALVRACPEGVICLAPSQAELSIVASGALRAAIGDFRPDIIFNAAAYTAVDAAEGDAMRARMVNDDAVAVLTTEAAAVGAKLVHVSTDFVFDGTAGTPYAPGAETNPLNVYGLTKRNGELKALAVPGARPLVVRTAWLYGADGSNFVLTMLKLMASKPFLAVVDDQIGSPTLVDDLAQALWVLATREVAGVLHYTNSGVASWYDFAVAIQDEALSLGLIEACVPIRPVSSASFVRAARRPAFSVLDKTATIGALGEHPAHWRDRLRHMLKGL